MTLALLLKIVAWVLGGLVLLFLIGSAIVGWILLSFMGDMLKGMFGERK